jgi:AcrR family transcriptional regulator
MNQSIDRTAERLLLTARELFSRHGYDGTSVRMITTRAGVNLGAITYHFGSKEALYAAVVRSVAAPLHHRVRAIATGGGAPLTRIAGIIAAYFEHFADHPDMPKLVIQQIFTDRPLPAPLRDAMSGILGAIVGVLAEGQADGSIRPGTPALLALSTLAQPIYFNIVRRPLAAAGIYDLADPLARREVIDHVTRLALAGLAAPSEEPPCQP